MAVSLEKVDHFQLPIKYLSFLLNQHVLSTYFQTGVKVLRLPHHAQKTRNFPPAEHSLFTILVFQCLSTIVSTFLAQQARVSPSVFSYIKVSDFTALSLYLLVISVLMHNFIQPHLVVARIRPNSFLDKCKNI